jgi:uncharacterized protein YodC (DUF2158 family)
MAFELGEVVMLRSGGQLMTVVAIDEEDIDCVWIGGEGHFFRETIPAAALVAVKPDEEDLGEDLEDESDDGDEADDEDESDEEDALEDETPKPKRRVA